MTMIKVIQKEDERPKTKRRKHKGRLLCRPAQLERISEMVQAMSEPEIITVVKTLREMGRI